MASTSPTPGGPRSLTITAEISEAKVGMDIPATLKTIMSTFFDMEAATQLSPPQLVENFASGFSDPTRGKTRLPPARGSPSFFTRLTVTITGKDHPHLQALALALHDCEGPGKIAVDVQVGGHPAHLLMYPNATRPPRAGVWIIRPDPKCPPTSLAAISAAWPAPATPSSLRSTLEAALTDSMYMRKVYSLTPYFHTHEDDSMQYAGILVCGVPSDVKNARGVLGGTFTFPWSYAGERYDVSAAACFNNSPVFPLDESGPAHTRLVWGSIFCRTNGRQIAAQGPRMLAEYLRRRDADFLQPPSDTVSFVKAKVLALHTAQWVHVRRAKLAKDAHRVGSMARPPIPPPSGGIRRSGGTSPASRSGAASPAPGSGRPSRGPVGSGLGVSVSFTVAADDSIVPCIRPLSRDGLLDPEGLPPGAPIAKARRSDTGVPIITSPAHHSGPPARKVSVLLDLQGTGDAEKVTATLQALSRPGSRSQHVSPLRRISYAQRSAPSSPRPSSTPGLPALPSMAGGTPRSRGMIADIHKNAIAAGCDGGRERAPSAPPSSRPRANISDPPDISSPSAVSPAASRRDSDSGPNQDSA